MTKLLCQNNLPYPKIRYRFLNLRKSNTIIIKSPWIWKVSPWSWFQRNLKSNWKKTKPFQAVNYEHNLKYWPLCVCCLKRQWMVAVKVRSLESKAIVNRLRLCLLRLRRWKCWDVESSFSLLLPSRFFEKPAAFPGEGLREKGSFVF